MGNRKDKAEVYAADGKAGNYADLDDLTEESRIKLGYIADYYVRRFPYILHILRDD